MPLSEIRAALIIELGKPDYDRSVETIVALIEGLVDAAIGDIVDAAADRNAFETAKMRKVAK